MTTNERAAQIWSVLALAALNRQVLTDNRIARLTGIARVGLGKVLSPSSPAASSRTSAR